MTEFFPEAPMLPYYKYSGQGNLYSPRGYAQGTLVDLLISRNQSDTTEELLEDTVEQNQPAFEEVKDSDTQSFFGGMDINEGDNLSFDDLSDLSLTDGLFGGTTVSDNAPKGWNTQHQKEFDALVAAGLKPQAKWTGNDWYVFAKELDGTPFGEPGSMTLSDTLTSGGKYGGQLIGLFGIAQTATGSFNPNDVFKKNLAEALQTKTEETEAFQTFDETGELPEEPIDPVIEAIQEQGGIPDRLVTQTDVAQVQKDKGSVTAKRGGTVTAKEGGTVKAKRPDPEPKPKPISLKKVIENAVADSKKKEARNEEKEKNKAAQAKARKDVQKVKQDFSGFTKGGYGF
jgi:hypothetical protein